MNPDNWTQLVLVLLAAALVAAGGGWLRFGQGVFPPVSAALLGAAALVSAAPTELSVTRGAMIVLVVLAGALAMAGGGPVTIWVFSIIDRNEPTGPTIASAGDVLRGGAWIGALERVAVFAGLVTGFPEALAIVLALKGVGRFPDLRGDGRIAATTERFIVGTFTSVLWAGACAAVVALVQR